MALEINDKFIKFDEFDINFRYQGIVSESYNNEEDENIRTDLGFGGMLMNFIVSPGQDTVLYNRNLDKFIAGYAHLYCYDFTMLEILLENTGFSMIEEKGFCVSEIDDYKEPLHVVGMDPIWQNFNKEFYKNNNLIHYYDAKQGKYNINFKVTGFDRDPLTSLIIEAKKDKDINLENFKSNNQSEKNYNQYAFSLMKDKAFLEKHKMMIDKAKK